MTYLTPAQFRLRSIIAPRDFDELERKRPGFVATALAGRSAMINARLAKRYAVPFATPSPDIVLVWLTDIVTLECYKALGFSPSSEQDKLIVDAATSAHTQITEAADSSVGLFELPLRADLPSTDAVEKGGPYGYSEPGPYQWLDAQREAVRDGRS